MLSTIGWMIRLYRRFYFSNNIDEVQLNVITLYYIKALLFSYTHKPLPPSRPLSLSLSLSLCAKKMDIRYLRRRRRYKRLGGTSNSKKRLKNTRLGGKTRRIWKLRLAPRLKINVSPIKLLAKIHDAYIDCMTHLVVNNNIVLFGGKRRIPQVRPVPAMVCATTSDKNGDSKLVVEIYKLVSSKELAVVLV